jgi:hypothetical protein
MTAELDLPPMRNLGPVRITCDPLDGHPAYAQMLAEAPRTSACPVWITSPDRLQVPDDPQAVVGAITRADPVAFMARRWMSNCPFCGCRDPFGDEFPGLQPALASAEDPVDAAARMAADPGRAYLAIVPVTRPADAVAAVGWTGACNYQEDLSGMSAVLRSWEERFGAMLVRMDSSTLWLSVAAPPRTADECQRVAAEHFTFCRDVDWEDPRPLRTYASTLLGSPRWRFWWD